MTILAKEMSKFGNSCKGAVIKYGTEGGGRDLTGSPKQLDGNRWAIKLRQVIKMGHKAICFGIFCNVLQLL